MLDLIISTLTQGFIYAMLSYGIYITSDATSAMGITVPSDIAEKAIECK